jgi:hypothetical protein
MYKMKKTKIFFWTITGLFSAFMLFSALPDMLLVPEAKQFMQHLGYPDYFTRFIGTLKALGVIAILIPGYPKIKEWAYAGLCFDLIGATYSQIANDGMQPQVAFMLLPFSLLIGSYIYFHKIQNTQNN